MKILLLGNEAIAFSLVQSGCQVATSYPGTPASEILPSIIKWKHEFSLPVFTHWAVNEKVAFELAFTASISGLRSAVSMKQVGLNVASDPLMSAAYMGVKAGMIVISADDPGPHSSQTEQDSRMFAMFAKIPVLDPISPSHAVELIAKGYELSESLKSPIMLRPTTRVCHTSQDIDITFNDVLHRSASFDREPMRWAATPKFRFLLHTELNSKLKKAAQSPITMPWKNITDKKRLIMASGTAYANTLEILQESRLIDMVSLVCIQQPFPLHIDLFEAIKGFDDVLVIEETMPVIEMQIADMQRVRGRLTGHVPNEGELLPEIIEGIISNFTNTPKRLYSIPQEVKGRRPSLCPGCPHRASFYGIKRAAPRVKTLYPSDIGCYTLGLNMRAIDTALCMGAAISMASGFYHSYALSGKDIDILATIGDSTFFHSGITALIDAVAQKARFVLVILDNMTTAMTGNQPTVSSGICACGDTAYKIKIEDIVKSSGVQFCRIANPFNFAEFTSLVKEAIEYSRSNGIAVVISRYPCVMDKTRQGVKNDKKVYVSHDHCTGCRYCINEFECPALVFDEQAKKTSIDKIICTHCAMCINVCPHNAVMQEG